MLQIAGCPKQPCRVIYVGYFTRACVNMFVDSLPPFPAATRVGTRNSFPCSSVDWPTLPPWGAELHKPGIVKLGEGKRLLAALEPSHQCYPAVSVLNGNDFLTLSPKLTNRVSCLPVRASIYSESSNTSGSLISYVLPQLF